MNKKQKIWIISRILLLVFAAAFYLFTTYQQWALALICLGLAFVMWLLPKFLSNREPSGICRSVEEDMRLDRLRREQKKQK